MLSMALVEYVWIASYLRYRKDGVAKTKSVIMEQ